MNFKKMMMIALLILLAAISVTRIAPWAADPALHKHSIAQTEEKISSVISLSGGAVATSATLSLLPGDMCTPLAEQLADLAKYFLMILSALYLEKLMITLSGYISFSVLIPLACLMLAASIAFGKKSYISLAGKVSVIALIIFLIVPASVTLSDMVYRTQAVTVNAAIEEYNDLEIEGEGGSGFLNEFTTITTDTIDNMTSFMDNLLESLAVMIVTACVIPVLVLVFLAWLFKMIFSSNVFVVTPASLEAITDRNS